jgi:hypothetical protein
MFIFKSTLKRANPFASYTDENGVRYTRIPRELLEEIAEPQPPKDYDEKLYFKVEVDDPPYVVYEKKSDFMLKYNRREELEGFIRQQEAETLLARPTREFMLTLFELEAVKAGLTPEQLALVNPGYAKVKELDVAITAARNEVRTITAEIGDDRNLLPVDEKPTETSV